MKDNYGFSLDKALTSWKKEPKLAELKDIFTEAKQSQREQIGRIQEWRDLMEGKGAVKSAPGRSSVQPKLIRKQAEWRYSALTEPFLSSESLFEVVPTTFEDSDGANQNELLLNWQFRTKINKIKFIDDLVRATVDEGTAIVRVGWERQTKEVYEPTPVFEMYPLEPQGEEDEQYMQLIEQLQQLAQLSQSNPRGFNETVDEEMKEAVKYFVETGVPVQAMMVDMVDQKVEKILRNQPTVEVLNPDDVYLDPTCKGNMDNAMFVIHAFDTSKHELLRSAGMYKNLDKIDWAESSTDPDRLGKEVYFKFKDEMKTKVTAYEYWGYHDINDDGMMVPIVATWVGDTLIRLEESPFPDGKLPFVVIPYLPIKRQVYGEPDAALLKDNQAIIGAVTRGVIDLLGRSANSQTAIPHGYLDVVNERRFKQGEDYFYHAKAGIHPSQAVYTHTFPQIPNTAFDMYTLQNQEAESYSGIKAFSNGISGSAYGQVAAGIRGALDATSKREMAILRRLAKGMVDIGTRIIAMNAEFLADTEVVRVTNRQFVEIKREDLKGNFDLIVDISTAEVDDAKAQDLSFMAQTIGPIAGPQAAMQLVAEIADIKRMPDVAERMRTFKQEPSEFDMQMQQIQLQKAQLELEELQSRIQMNMAVAAEKGSKADLNSVNATEQGSGVKHKREMEKQKAQSQGNQNLMVTKALTQGRKEGESNPNIEAAIGFNKLTELSGQPAEEELRDNEQSVRPVNNNAFFGR